MEIVADILMIIVVLYAVMMFYYIKGWKSLPYYMPAYHNIEMHTKVTVIIPARNEEDNIKACLTDIVGQYYPQELLQIVVVDDNSTDNTIGCVKRLQENYSNIELISLKDNTGNAFKKQAISKAISVATGELIISTDADCRMKPNWLPLLVSYYQEYQPKMIAGPVSFDNEKSIFEYMQNLEFLGLIGIGAASIANKMPTMCNGANLAYQKEAFTEVGGFSAIDDLASGDDTFLMFKIEKRYPGRVHFIKNIQATIYTNAKQSLSEFVSQRKRWASKSAKYDNTWVKIVAVLVYITNIAVLTSAVFAIVNTNMLPSFCFIAGVKVLADLLFLMPVLSFFKRQNLLWLFIPEQILYALYVVIIGAIAPFGKYNWKGRIVK